MTFHTDNLQLVVAMTMSAIFIAVWLASKKNIIIDFIVALLVLCLVLCILVQFLPLFGLKL